jgi:drug/metabolite transporter (DMT)-like permease
MTENCIDTRFSRVPTARPVLLGMIGVLAFSFTLPATRLAVGELDHGIVGLGRAVVAAACAALLLLALRQPVPPRRVWGGLAITALGIVFGFPYFSAWALTLVPAAHGAVIVGLLPAATALMAVLRAGERPSLRSWLAMLLGLATVVLFAAAQGAGRPQLADLLILVAVLLGGLGYAEGARVSREIGGWQTISWALLLSLPILLPLVGERVAARGLAASGAAWAGFAYVSLVSMYFAFFPWYRALASGGVARIGQLQLAQPVLTMLWSALLLGEQVTLGMALTALLVLASVALTQRSFRAASVSPTALTERSLPCS